MDEPNLKPPVLFISDAHLGGFSEAENARIEKELIQLIDYCQDNGIRLVVLGDLFDYWMEFPDYIPPLGEALLRRFRRYNRQLGPTLFISGNHDNWTRGHLEACGFYVEPEYVIVRLQNRRCLLLHGDGLRNGAFDLKRPLMHRMLRHPLFIRYYQQVLSPRLGLRLMKYFSRFNRWMDRDRDYAAPLNRWAEELLEDAPLDFIICGHDHVPRRKHFSFGSYINLGTFFKHRTMAFYNNGAVSLVHWKPDTCSLKPVDSIS